MAADDVKDGLGDGRAALEGRLALYQKTLSEIYELYDTRLEELSLIRRVSDALKSSLKLEKVLLSLAEIVSQEVVLDSLRLLMRHPATGALAERAVYTARQDRARYLGEGVGRRVTGPAAAELAQLAEALILDQGEKGPAGLAGPVGASRLLLPLVAAGELVGLFFLSRGAALPFGQEEVRVLTIIADQAAATLANLRRIDELGQANQQLTASERAARATSQRLASLLEAANDIIFTLDKQGRVTYVNRKIADWGWSPEELVGKGLDFLAHQRETGLCARLAAGPAANLEASFTSRGGDRRDGLVSVSPLAPRAAGDALLVMVRDITERKKLESQLFQAEKLSSIGVLAAGVAHEVGNPLSAISGYAQILQAGAATKEEAAEYLEAIASQVERIMRIIQDLLDYARPSDAAALGVDLGRALDGALAMLTAQAAFRDIQIETVLEDAPLKLGLAQDHLTQLVINIALNAAQAMEGRGRLTIRARRDAGVALLTFADTGPGFAPQALPRLFDPFFTTKPAGRGTGLGLAICQRIVDSYHGRIHAANQQDGGAIFTLALPLATEEQGG